MWGITTTYHRGHYVGVTIDPSLEAEVRYSLIHEFEDEELMDVENQSEKQIKVHLRRVVGEIWNTSDLSTRGSMITSLVNSMTWRSRILAEGAALQSSKIPVLNASNA